MVKKYQRQTWTQRAHGPNGELRMLVIYRFFFLFFIGVKRKRKVRFFFSSPLLFLLRRNCCSLFLRRLIYRVSKSPKSLLFPMCREENEKGGGREMSSSVKPPAEAVAGTSKAAEKNQTSDGQRRSDLGMVRNQVDGVASKVDEVSRKSKLFFLCF